MFKIKFVTHLLIASALIPSHFVKAEQSEVEALKARIATRDRTLLKHVAPIYPAQAFEQKLTGSVTMSFTINLDGSVTNIVVLEAEPKNVFDDAAVKALSQWQYAAVKNPITQVLTKFDFAP